MKSEPTNLVMGMIPMRLLAEIARTGITGTSRVVRLTYQRNR